jgi:hypothetical protein
MSGDVIAKVMSRPLPAADGFFMSAAAQRQHRATAKPTARRMT